MAGEHTTNYIKGWIESREIGMDLVEKLNRVEAREAELRDMLEQIVKILRDPDKSFLSMWEAVWKIIGPTLSLSRPGHEVLSREHIEAAAERESRIEEFLQLLASEGEAKFLEVREIVEDIAARDNISADVKQEALRRIGEAREKLGVVTNDL